MMTFKHALMTVAAPIALLAAPAADAAVYAFTMTGSYDARFDITTDQLGMATTASADEFYITNVAGTFGGVSRTASTISFLAGSFDGGLVIDLGVTSFGFLGNQLFTGTTASPTFRLGTFNLVSDDNAAPVVLNITDASAVPEPSSWAMMVGGFGIVGAAMRRMRVNRLRVRFVHA